MLPNTDIPTSSIITTPKSSTGSMDVHPQNPSSTIEPRIQGSNPNIKPIVIGAYGISGSGKSTLLSQLEQKLGTMEYQFYEGTTMISSLFPEPDGLDRFRNLPPEEKTRFREMAIRKIGEEATVKKKIAIVTGHYMFWSQEAGEGTVAWTQGDLEVYTHIIYLDLPESTLAMQREKDEEKKRPNLSEDALEEWKSRERDELRRICYEAGITFAAVKCPNAENVARLVEDWTVNVLTEEEVNTSRALAYLDGILAKFHHHHYDTVIFIDGDKTLTASDTGSLFWDIASQLQLYSNLPKNPLKHIFSGKGGYSFSAFRQAAILYSELDDDGLEDVLGMVAQKVEIYPEFRRFIDYVVQETGDRVKILVVTCGMACVWESVIHKENCLPLDVDVIGGGYRSGEFIVTPDVKAALVTHTQTNYHGTRVWAFGDSPLDLAMLCKADRAFVVVGPEQSRSKSMESALAFAIENDGLQACQILLGGTSHPRLDDSKLELPIIRLDDRKLLDALTVVRDRVDTDTSIPIPGNIVHLTDTPAAKLLMTPTRDARVHGPALQSAHKNIGWFLAIQVITKVIGLEDVPDIPHVQGHSVVGHRLSNESSTTIVALMRGGEPMARGVNEAFQGAAFVHAKHTEDLTSRHLEDQKTVILVDSVVNSGKTVVEFVKHIRGIYPERIQIVVVVGVLQEKAVMAGDLYDMLVGEGDRLKIVALRLSKNKFTGKGGTDTGNRLFNTTRLD